MAILPDDVISAGLQTEIGYAIHAGKKILVGTLVGQEPGFYFNQGLIELGLVSDFNFSYKELDKLNQRLREALI